MPKKVLVADDSVTIHKVVSLTFADEDVVIETATDGNQALAKAREFRPDLVLADVFMPGRNGYEVCESLKRNPQLADIPVVLMVGTFEHFDEAEASRVKCDGHLTKPFDTSELLGVFNSLLRKEPETTRVNGTVAAGKSASLAAESSTSPLVSHKTLDSFLGSGKILDLFGADMFPAAPVQAAVASEEVLVQEEAVSAEPPASTEPVAPATESSEPVQAEEAARGSDVAVSQVIPFPGVREIIPGQTPAILSEEAMDAIVERVVRRISHEVLREIAWEVIPEMAENLIRQHLKERGLAQKTSE